MSWIARCNGQRAFGKCLQQSCKSKKVVCGACKSLANGKKNFLALATLLQMEKSSLRRLQQSCKWEKVLFGACNNLASEKKALWHLQECCKHFQKRFGYRNSPLALFLHRTSRCVDEQKAQEGVVLMRLPCQRPLARRGEIKTASIFAAAKRKNDGSVAQLDRATAF